MKGDRNSECLQFIKKLHERYTLALRFVYTVVPHHVYVDNVVKVSVVYAASVIMVEIH